MSKDDLSPVDSVDWEAMDGRSRLWLLRPVVTVTLFAGIVALGVVGVRSGALELTVLDREVSVVESMYRLALVAIAVNVVAWAYRSPARARTVCERLASRRPVLASAGILASVLVFTTVLASRWEEPPVDPGHSFQPPVWSSVESIYVTNCEGREVGDVCRGSLEFPLGTGYTGQDLLTMTVHGLHTSFQVGVVAAVCALGMGLTVGVVAGYRGGWVDELLMRYVDLQFAFPAFFAYIFLRIAFEPHLALLILVFGLLSWGGIARVVRTEVVKHRSEPYVLAAEATGAGRTGIVVRHVVPNVSNTVVTAATLLVPKFVLYETALSFLNLGDDRVVSLGTEISTALNQEGVDWWVVPWTVAVPVCALIVVVLAISLLGDAFRDELDPRE